MYKRISEHHRRLSYPRTMRLFVMKRLQVICSLLLTFLAMGSASKCPEPRKPHPTSCTIFYNCVNLPGGGYVWAPAKCTNGLVFQPYLRICVLPGDSWACDILATEPPEVFTSKQIPELIDSTQTSYLGYAEDDISRFGEPIDSYHKIDKYTEAVDGPQPTVTPYPLIEVTPPNPYINQIDSTIKNIGLPIAIKHSEDNYLYHFSNGQQVLATPMNANADQLQTHLQHLTELIERLTVYQGTGIPLDRQPPTATPPSTTTTTTNSPLSYDYYNNANRSPIDNQDSAILNFLIKNYILQKSETQTSTVPPVSEVKEEITTLQDEVETTQNTSEETLDILLNAPEAADNIVVVRDNLDNLQYFTISKYKSIAHQLTTETVEVIPCTNGVRLPNSTDCTKYYSCNPDTAKLRQFSCPKNTAFNQYKRLCEMNEYTLCTSDSSESSLRISATTGRPQTRDAQDQGKHISDKNPCQAIGKQGDPTSDTHYYLCYSDKGKNTDMRYHRMVCPNSLVFCQTRNVCTTKKRCEGL